MYYLSICAVFRQENPWIEEWVEYHHARGVEHFYLYNNDQDPWESNRILKKYQDCGLVDNIPMQGDWIQGKAYSDGIQRSGRNTQWLALIDLDEFILPRKNNDIRTVLEEFESESGLVVHWNIFGSGGRQVRPSSQIHHFLWRGEDTCELHRCVKSIIRPQNVDPKIVVSSHNFNYTKGFAVNENHVPCFSPHENYTGSILRVNHYCVRSRQDFVEVKTKRGLAAPADDRDEEFWNLYDRNEVHDDEISKRFGNDKIL